MPLVDYASSDEDSENDSNESGNEEDVSSQNKPSNPVIDTASDKDSSDQGNATIFSALPKPKANTSFLGDDNKLSKLLLGKKVTGEKSEKESVKISVPSVSEFDDEKDQPAAKKLKPSTKGVGLFSVLPPPKNNSVKETNRTFIPYSVGKSQVKQTSNTKINSVQKSELSTEKEGSTKDEEDEDTPVGSSFFGLSEPSVSGEPENVVNNDNVYEEPQSEVSQNAQMSYDYMQPMPEPNPGYSSMQESIEDSYSYSTPIGPEMIPLENNPLELDEKALQILCGNKKKRQHMPMNIIDLSGEEIMPDSKEWLLKQFTEEKKVRSHSHKKGTGPSSQSRRKHQITYLAHQAKAQELELQNQWANNRMSRKQTQSKYGF